jgi:hypothetical protein
MVSQPRTVQPSRWDEAIFLMIPGTSCLATIVLSLRDKYPEALLKLALIGFQSWELLRIVCQRARPVGLGKDTRDWKRQHRERRA